MGKSFVTGIDIGHHSIKAVVVKPVGEQFELVTYAEVPVSGAIFSDNHTVNHQEIVKNLKRLKKQLPMRAKKVVLAVPDSAVISKLLHIDSELEEREKEFALYQLFAQQSPFPIEELSLDYVKLEPERATVSSTSTYQVYATRKEVIESRVEVIKKSGFTPWVMDLQAHGLLRVWQMACQEQAEKANGLLVDIGQSQTSICILPAGRPAYYKDFPFGTEQLPSSLTTSQAVSEPSFTLSLEPPESFIAELAERLTRQLSLYASVNQQHQIDGVWLTGGGATLLGLEESLSTKLNLPVARFNPFARLQGKLTIPERMEPCTFGVAVGLALKGLQWQGGKHVA